MENFIFCAESNVDALFFKEPIKFSSMFLFFQGFQPQNVITLLLFAMKHSYLLTVKTGI